MALESPRMVLANCFVSLYKRTKVSVKTSEIKIIKDEKY